MQIYIFLKDFFDSFLDNDLQNLNSVEYVTLSSSIHISWCLFSSMAFSVYNAFYVLLFKSTLNNRINRVNILFILTFLRRYPENIHIYSTSLVYDTCYIIFEQEIFLKDTTSH